MDTYEARFLHGRVDSRGHEEEGKARAWLVLSGLPTHNTRLLIGASVTHASDRPYREYLLEDIEFHPSDQFDAERQSVDLQQIWTFPVERDKTARPVPTLSEDCATIAIAALRTRLSRYFDNSSPQPRERQLSVGRVVWIELVPLSDRSRSDVRAIEVQLEHYGVRRPSKPNAPFRIPAVIVATSARLREANKDVRALITVVPLGGNDREALDERAWTIQLILPSTQRVP